MYSTRKLIDGRLLARHALGAAGAVVLVATLTACGSSDGETASAYQSICQVQADCLDDQFDRMHGTVDGCAATIKANAKISTKTGECLQATKAVYECRADEVQCQNNQVSYGGACTAEVSAQTKACRGEVVGAATMKELCGTLKACLGESDFNSNYGSLETCVDDYEASVSQYSQACKEIVSELYYCLTDNLQCVQGQPDSKNACDAEAAAFNRQCNSN